MKTLKAHEEIKKGNHDIGFISSWVQEYVQDKEIQEVPVPTYWTLEMDMKDSEILADQRTQECTLSDIYAFLKNPPEGTKDGDVNLFYLEGTDRVVSVDWGLVRGWNVLDWHRDGGGFAGKMKI